MNSLQEKSANESLTLLAYAVLTSCIIAAVAITIHVVNRLAAGGL